jgi:hypothetical protein
MIRYLLAAALISVAPFVQAEEAGPNQGPVMDHSMHGSASMSPARPMEPGQGAFAAIQEIVALLDADPTTDWAKVDIEGLRRHLIDMDNVTLRANVSAAPADGGMAFTVTGSDEVRDSIIRMVTAHAATMNGVAGFTYETAQNADGATLVARAANPTDVEKLQGLGFIGVMTLGAHHQTHHIAIARGDGPHN